MQFSLILCIVILLTQCHICFNQCYSTSGINVTQRNEIINATNIFRQKVARGEIKGQPSSSNMRVISWDDELEMLATAYAKTCPQTNNPIKKTPSYSYVGENMYSITNVTLNLTAVVEVWFNEVVNFNSSNIISFIALKNPYHQYLNYTQLLWGRTTKMGCGLIQENATNKWTLVCNYQQPGNIEKSVMYEPGISCYACPEQCSPIWPGLCLQEPAIMVNGLTLEDFNYIVLNHNRFRTKAALGEEPGLPQAANMNQVEWDDEIALYAQKYSGFGPDERSYKPTNKNNELLGENIFIFPGKDLLIQPNASTIAQMALEYWHSLSTSITYSMISQPNPQISPIKMQQLQMIQWNVTLLGCGYSQTSYKDHIFVCNYYSPVKFTESVQKIGQNRRDCSKSQSSSFLGLCNPKENQTGQLILPYEPLQRLPSIICNANWRFDAQLDICIFAKCSISNCVFCWTNESWCERCANGYKLENGACRVAQCLPNCEICLNDNYCDKCTKGYYSEGGSCKKCSGNCSKCLAQNTSFCLECYENATIKPFSQLMYAGKIGSCEYTNKSANSIDDMIKTVNKNTFYTNQNTTSYLATYFLSWLQQNSTQALNNSSIIEMQKAYLDSYTTFLAESEAEKNTLPAILTTFDTMDALCAAGRTQNTSLVNYFKKCTSLLQGIKSTDFVEKVQVKDIFTLVGKAASVKNLTIDIKSDIQKSQITSRKALWNLTNKADIEQTENNENISILMKIKHAKPKKKENGSGTYLASNISGNSSIFVDISTKTSNATDDIVIEAVELDEEIAQGMLPNSSTLDLCKFKVLEINALNSNQENIITGNLQITNKLQFAIPKESISKQNNSKWTCIQIESENPLEWKNISNGTTLLDNNVIECLTNHFSYQTVVLDTGFDLEAPSNKKLIIIVGSIAAVVLIIIGVFIYYAWRRRRKSKEQMRLAEKMGIGLK